ncbi:MAG: Asp-tRNA(Asn)/Glu-tRNA(Gln) amidotransferase subunit GatC [Desulfuromonadia bacterium]
MVLTKSDVKKVARLARLALSDQEIEELTPQLAAIIGYVETMNELDTTSVEPTSHAVPMSNALREDRVTPSLPVEELLANAPARLGDYFLVPKVIE